MEPSLPASFNVRLGEGNQKVPVSCAGTSCVLASDFGSQFVTGKAEGGCQAVWWFKPWFEYFGARLELVPVFRLVGGTQRKPEDPPLSHQPRRKGRTVRRRTKKSQGEDWAGDMDKKHRRPEETARHSGRTCLCVCVCVV